MSGLYSEAELAQARPTFQRTTNQILDRLIWPSLMSDEKRRLGGEPPPFELPLYAEGQARGDPLAFYSFPGRRSIVTPVLSLKFLDDLCTANAWLNLHGYTLETISDYMAIVGHGRPPPQGFPPPLPTLGIPADARADPQVDKLARDLSVTARTFLMLHEMGHIEYGHRARSFEESIRNEEEADRFAVEGMRRMGLFPSGIILFFEADAHRASYPPSGAETHPLTGDRVRALADAVDEPTLKNMFRRLGDLLDDPDIRRSFVAVGRQGDFSALAPRRPGELPRRAASPSSGGAGAFSGTYRGEIVQFPDLRPLPLELFLERSGQDVRGQFSFGVGMGLLQGSLEGDRLYFDWEWGDYYGRGILESQGADAFSGTWGYRQVRTGAGTWTGRRGPAPGGSAIHPGGPP